MNQLMADDIYKWLRILQDGERGGLQLTAPDCYALSTLLECAHDDLLSQSAELDVLRRTVNVLDPEGSRRRMELQRKYGEAPYEERTRGEDARSKKAAYRAGKPVFRNL